MLWVCEELWTYFLDFTFTGIYMGQILNVIMHWAESGKI